MKRFFFLFLAMAALIAQANPVNKQLAREVGAKFLYASTLLKSDNASELQWVTTYRISQGEEAFYVFNYPQGFVIVSADDCATPILGYSDEGAFSPDNIPVQMEEYLQNFVEQIQYGIENHLTADDETARQWASVKTTGRLNDQKGTSALSPLVTATWDQGCYYNQFCPSTSDGPCNHAYVGCVATAMGQIMHYWSYPATGNGSYSYVPQTHPEYGTQSANFGATTYQWSNMPNMLSNSSNAVATLLYHCGVAVSMDYGGNADAGSGASPSMVCGALTNYFRYANDCSLAFKNYYDNNSWFALIKSNLDQGVPVYYSGYSSNYDGGHAFVCDGYDASNQLHFNWGWSGSCNGYFALGALTPNGNEFSYNNLAVVNIHPPVNPSITYQVSASVLPATGGTVTGTGYYQAYQLCTLTATPASSYSFIGWKEGETMVSTEATYSFPVKQNRNLTAVFGLPPVCSVSAAYYPDASDQASSSVQVSWEGLISQSWGFEEGLEGWTTIDADGDGYTWGHFSGDGIVTHSGYGVAASESFINNLGALNPDNWLISPQVQLGGVMTFWAAGQDPSWAQEHFAVYVSTSNNNVSSFTQVMNETVATGNMTQYTVDLSAYSGNGYVAIRHFHVSDMFRLNVDDVTLSNGEAPLPPQASLSEGFELGIPADWTQIDADGDGYLWGIEGYLAHNSSSCVSSASFINNVGPLHPDNYLVSPRIALGGVFSFWACAQDAAWPAEHFGVAVSTTTNNSASAFTTVQQWTLTAKEGITDGSKGTRDQGNWYQFTVNLSSYAGQTGYIAIRHFNCTDKFYLNVDDISYGFGKDAPQIQYYRVYRSTCDNNNLRLVADQQMGTSYVDNNWGNLPFGTYKYGVCSVGEVGNESDLVWSNCLDRGVGHTINVSANPNNGGNACCTGVYEEGTTCTLTAIPNANFDFVKWTKDGVEVSTNASYSFTVTEDADYVAHFQLKSYTVTVEADPEEGGTVSAGGTYNHGSTCQLIATANPGYRFVNWTKNGVLLSNAASCSFQVTEDAECVAHFIAQYTITALANPEDGGDIEGDGTFDAGSYITLTAAVHEGYEFVNWTESDVEVCSNPDYSFTVTCDRTLMANFELKSYQISVNADPSNGGSVDGGGLYSHGANAVITAEPNDGFEFVNWTKDNMEVSQDAIYHFQVLGAGEYVAHFTPKVYYVKVTAEPAAGGLVDGEGYYEHGSSVTVSVTPHDHYVLLNWTENGVVVDTAISFTFEVYEDHEFIANLEFVEAVDEQTTSAFMLYPNPVSDILTIEAKEPVHRCEVYSINGTMLMLINEGFDQRLELDLKSFPVGHYMIRLTTDGSVQTRRFVKQ